MYRYLAQLRWPKRALQLPAVVSVGSTPSRPNGRSRLKPCVVSKSQDGAPMEPRFVKI